ncbi:hypothetical protein [Saccharothrix saharensis]|uniref:hypothetical protein n=1 Tax=Saccharothrix saharensis TaxID=571190 RepID=UPI00114E9F1A|nr:hypothetical protein [Saccharothrix saharensis]
MSFAVALSGAGTLAEVAPAVGRWSSVEPPVQHGHRQVPAGQPRGEHAPGFVERAMRRSRGFGALTK